MRTIVYDPMAAVLCAFCRSSALSFGSQVLAYAWCCRGLPELVCSFLAYAAVMCVLFSQVLAYAGVPEAALSKLKANEWVSKVLGVLGGKGGGKPTLAQGQGSQVDKVGEAAKLAHETAAAALQ